MVMEQLRSGELPVSAYQVWVAEINERLGATWADGAAAPAVKE
jgi:hypothetical protein